MHITNKFCCYLYHAIATAHLDDADRVAAAIQRRACAARPKDFLRRSRHRARLGKRRGGGGGGDDGEEERRPTQQPRRHGGPRGKGGDRSILDLGRERGRCCGAYDAFSAGRSRRRLRRRRRPWDLGCDGRPGVGGWGVGLVREACVAGVRFIGLDHHSAVRSRSDGGYSYTCQSGPRIAGPPCCGNEDE